MTVFYFFAISLFLVMAVLLFLDGHHGLGLMWIISAWLLLDVALYDGGR